MWKHLLSVRRVSDLNLLMVLRLEVLAAVQLRTWANNMLSHPM